MEYQSHILKYLIPLCALNLLLFFVTIPESTGTSQGQPEMSAQGPQHVRYSGSMY